jgi:ferredoxin-NADP reductase
LKIARGDTDHVHVYCNDGDAPVVRVQVSKVEEMTTDVTKYEFKTLDGSPLPEWSAGAHLDIVVAPEFLRQYSMSGDPADRSKYQIGVLREDEGRGGSKMMHRIFVEGRKVFISKPINHFQLIEDAQKSFLMGGGIGITPMIAFAHRLHALGHDFEMHYSVSRQDAAGYLADLATVPWADKVTYYFSDQGTRADFDEILSGYQMGWHVYACGPERYMNSVIAAASAVGFPEDAQHLEYFAVPEQPDYENNDFKIRLTKSGQEYAVPADKSAADVLIDAGYSIDLKCSDGICGVCKCGVLSGDIEHRDFVLSKKQRENQMILCQSRAKEKDGVIEIDL